MIRIVIKYLPTSNMILLGELQSLVNKRFTYTNIYLNE